MVTMNIKDIVLGERKMSGKRMQKEHKEWKKWKDTEEGRVTNWDLHIEHPQNPSFIVTHSQVDMKP